MEMSNVVGRVAVDLGVVAEARFLRLTLLGSVLAPRKLFSSVFVRFSKRS